jgi:hypothetical protein
MKSRATTVSLIGTLAAIIFGCAGHATAQLRAPADLILIDPLPARSFGPAAADRGTNASFSLWPVPSRPASAGWQSWESSASRISLIEVPTDALVSQPTRPHYALGFSSETLRGWMTDLGVGTSECIAPIVRMRARVDSGGDFRGALWVHARCSLR